ncbi:hypothetical protein EDD18DRAFT_1368514 [Armillaria luteobubalina]|uniref:Peptidase C14 caspase domain-containing protein n=1 Tax=Armillaria luteobubalina TaxID=153913 RepID=A0AA39NXQ9_9AGAR|nr:hypothetical protein EDD18DRAFT_1368514 [Armillaria luteobubalina]
MHIFGKVVEACRYLDPWSNETPNSSITSEEQRTYESMIRPTRKNIIDMLLKLSTNHQIQHGNNIIIYFSGHGSTYSCSDIYPAGSIADTGAIEALCPMDCTPSDSSHISTPDISDHEFNIILAEISRTKGHHITCILDYCHSLGVTRVPNTQRYQGRSAKPLLPTPSSCKDMLDAGHSRLKDLESYHDIYNGNWRSDMTSHIILAACQSHELAKEDDRIDGCSGIFTHMLLEALRSDRLEAGSTYYGLLKAIQMPQNTKQTPIAAGEHMDVQLWYQNSDV